MNEAETRAELMSAIAAVPTTKAIGATSSKPQAT